MKVLILGTGKTGTTAMVYKVSGGLPNCHAFSGGLRANMCANLKMPFTSTPMKNAKVKAWMVFQEHLEKEHYNRKIWMARDPRDAAVSRMLYRWHRGYDGCKQQFEKHLELVLKKEQDPASVPFSEICRYCGHQDGPRTVAEVVVEETHRYQQMSEFVKGFGKDWILFRFEDMVANKFDALNEYLGFEVQSDANVPSTSGKAKVIRKKDQGRLATLVHRQKTWSFSSHLICPTWNGIGYDCNDWKPTPILLLIPNTRRFTCRTCLRKQLKTRFSDIWIPPCSTCLNNS